VPGRPTPLLADVPVTYLLFLEKQLTDLRTFVDKLPVLDPSVVWLQDPSSGDWRSEPAEICVPGGERLADVAERAWNGLNQIVQRHPDAERILVVSHNFPILGIVCRITGTHLNDYRSFHLDPCGVTRLAYHAGHWNLTEVNGREYTRTALPYSQNGRSSATK